MRQSHEVQPIYRVSNLITQNQLLNLPSESNRNNCISYQQSDDPKVAVGFEILELYAEPVDTGYVLVPEIYERIEKD
jgi:hypothetical protein